MYNGITFRQGTKDDAMFIADTICEVMGTYTVYNREFADKIHKSVFESALIDNTLYNYNNATIAEKDGNVIGLIISYPGLNYLGFRVHTFYKLFKDTGVDLTSNPLETVCGEYYLDSMMVLKEYRGQGIGAELINKAVEKAKILGIKSVSFIVKESSNKLCDYYEKIGFCRNGKLDIFNDTYIRMNKPI